MNKVCVKGQRIYFYRPPEPIPKAQVNFSKIEFDMDETWSSFLSVVAQFIQNGKPKNVQVEDGYCFVPSELGVGAFELCLRGDDGESVVASVNRLTLEVCEGFDPSGETPLPPSPDLYTQLIKEIDSGKKIAQSVREDADSGKFNGPPGKSPKIIDGNWFVWDFETGAYVDTGVAASGGGGGGAVSSVNGQTGEVKLTAKDVGAISQDDLQEATNEVLAQAKASGEFDGQPGEKGDTGAPGADGAQGKPGKDGTDGKSAYAYAQDGGYAGTEEEFAAKLASGSLQVMFTEGNERDDGVIAITADKTVAECIAAYKSGVPVYGTLDPTGTGYLGVMSTFLEEYNQVVFRVDSPQTGLCAIVIGTDDSWMALKTSYALKADIPAAVYVTFTDNGDGTGTADKTWAEIQAAYKNGSTIIGSIDTEDTVSVISGVCVVGQDETLLMGIGGDVKMWAAMIDSTDTVIIASMDVIPGSLPNPNALTFTGAVSGSYDGSEAKMVNIPTVPSSLKNPKALTFTGAATGSYDGSSAKTVNIPTVPSALKNPSKIIFTGAASGEYDGSAEVVIDIPTAGAETETVLSDNLLDKSAMTYGGLFYFGSSGFQYIAQNDVYYGYIPLRGAGTYRTKWNNSQHSATGGRIAILKEDNTFLQNATGTLTNSGNNYAYDFEFTVTSAMIAAGAAKIAFDCHSSIIDTVMIVKGREYPTEYIPYGYIEVATDSGKKMDNVLMGKTAVFLGDSICAGTTVGDDSEYYGYGWAGLIGEKNRMTWANYGMNGGTVTSLEGVQETRWLDSQLDKAITEHPEAEYILFEGGCNDADQMGDAKMGVISSDYSTFDTTTFSGALESLILKIITAYPTAKVGYIIPQKMYAQNDHSATGHVHRRFFDRAVEICEKWGIPIIDLWKNCPINPKLATSSTFYTDGQHLTLAGYQRITPQIEAFMRSL